MRGVFADVVKQHSDIEALQDAIDWIVSVPTPPRPDPSAWTENTWVNYWREKRTEVAKRLDEMRLRLWRDNMRRHGFRPSNDDRWERIAQEAIAKAEREDVSLHSFYEGLVAIMDSLEARLSAGPSEVGADE